MVRMSKIQEAVYRKFLTVMQEGYGDQLNPIRIFAVCSKVRRKILASFRILIVLRTVIAVLDESGNCIHFIEICTTEL